MIPDNVEKIIMTKEDYDRNVEQMILNKIELEERVIKVIEDLEQTKKVNNHFKDKHNNELINVDIDHIDYLLKILRGEKNEDS